MEIIFLPVLVSYYIDGGHIGPVKNRNGNYEIARHEGKGEAKLKPFDKVK